MLDTKLVSNLVKNTQVSVIGPLHEGIEHDCHFIQLEGIVNHDLNELINTILKEEEFSLLGFLIQKFVSNDAEGFDHQGEKVG